MSRSSNSSLEILLGLFGGVIALLWAFGTWIWRLYTDRPMATQGTESNDDCN